MKELFEQFWNDRDDIDDYIYRCWGELHNYCAERFEINGYLKTKLTENPLDDEYFSNVDRQNLFVLMCAENNKEVLDLFTSIYTIGGLNVPTIKDIEAEIYRIKEKGIEL